LRVSAVCVSAIFSLLLDSFGVLGFYKGQERKIGLMKTHYFPLALCLFLFLAIPVSWSCVLWNWILEILFWYPFAYFGCRAFVAFESVRDSIISIERFR
jgi:hypothetical protein